MSGGRFISGVDMGRCGCCKTENTCDIILFTPVQILNAIWESGKLLTQKYPTDFYIVMQNAMPYPFVYDYSNFSKIGTNSCSNNNTPITGIYYNLCGCSDTYYPSGITISQPNQITSIINDNYNYIAHSFKPFNNPPYRKSCKSSRDDYDRRVPNDFYNNKYINNNGTSIISFSKYADNIKYVSSFIDSSGLHVSGVANENEKIGMSGLLYSIGQPYGMIQFVKASGDSKIRFLDDDVIKASIGMCKNKSYCYATAYDFIDNGLIWDYCLPQTVMGLFTSDLKIYDPINANIPKLKTLKNIDENSITKMTYPIYYEVIPPKDPPEVTLDLKNISVNGSSDLYSGTETIPLSEFDPLLNIPACNTTRISNKAKNISEKLKDFSFSESYETKYGLFNNKYYKEIILKENEERIVYFDYIVDPPDLGDFNNLLYYYNTFPSSKVFKPIIPLGYSIKLKFKLSFNPYSNNTFGSSFIRMTGGSNGNTPSYFDECGNHKFETNQAFNKYFCNNYPIKIDPTLEEYKRDIVDPPLFSCILEDDNIPMLSGRKILRPDIPNDGNLYAYYVVTVDFGTFKLYPETAIYPYYQFTYPQCPEIPYCFPYHGTKSYNLCRTWSAYASLSIPIPTAYDYLDPFQFKNGKCYSKDGKCIHGNCDPFNGNPYVNQFVYDAAMSYGYFNISVELE